MASSTDSSHYSDFDMSSSDVSTKISSSDHSPMADEAFWEDEGSDLLEAMLVAEAADFNAGGVQTPTPTKEEEEDHAKNTDPTRGPVSPPTPGEIIGSGAATEETPAPVAQATTGMELAIVPFRPLRILGLLGDVRANPEEGREAKKTPALSESSEGILNRPGLEIAPAASVLSRPLTTGGDDDCGGGGVPIEEEKMAVTGMELAIVPAPDRLPLSPGDGEVQTPPPAGRTGKEVALVEPLTSERTPDWLPEAWEMRVHVRTSGASAGKKDRYYYRPDSGRRFRSKYEVLCFKQHGKVFRRKPKPILIGQPTPISVAPPAAEPFSPASHDLECSSSSSLKRERPLNNSDALRDIKRYMRSRRKL